MPHGHVAACRSLLAPVLLALSIAAPSAIAQPVVVEELVRNTPGGIVRGYFATVDLQDPRVEVVTTGVAPVGTCNAALTTTTSFRSTNNLTLAINANYFGTGGACAAGRGDTIGLLVSDGVVVSNARQYLSNPPDPAIMFTTSKLATIGNLATSTPGIWDAVAGVGPSATDTDPGTLLVTDGVNTGATARVTPTTRNPRTGMGVSKDGKTLYICVVDGLQANWSVGMTLPEFADIFVQKGAWRALNLDGGGSSSFAFQRPDNSIALNKPSDGSFRSVAANFGIRVTSAPAITDRWTRPLRGVWLRPPGGTTTSYPNVFDAAGFENTVSLLAAAGIQDLFLETLYWGRDTGQTGVSSFPPRFGANDTLGQAIVIAAKYGVRVQAWCETGYLDFGTSPSAFLAANPSYVVRPVGVARGTTACPTPNTLTGDQANQRFVNLGNPGVRTALSNYFSALRTNYPGLEGIQADYHFFPLGNPPANANNTAPMSYDTWTLANYRDANGNLVNPLTSATNCTGAVTYNSTTFVVNSGAHSNWINWNRKNVTDALVLLRAAVDGSENGGSGLFSAVSFGSWNSAIHLSKMAELPAWGTNYGADAFFIMAYGFSTGSIDTELQNAQTALPNRRVVAGLANLINSDNTFTRPSVTAQLNTVAARGIQDFMWFEGSAFINNGAGLASTFRTDLRNWIDTVATPQVGDINRDGYIDARDLALFGALYTGTPIVTTIPTTRYDLNADGTIDSEDQRLLTRQFNRSHFGEDGIIDRRDLAALRNCFTPGSGTPAPTAILNLWDLNGDGAVDYRDELIAIDAMTVTRTLDLDVDNNGVVDIEDLYRQFASPIDVGNDGGVTFADTAILLRALRAGEVPDITQGRR